MSGSPFKALPAQVDLGQLDRRIIAWWRDRDVFRRSLDQTAGGPSWTFYEGPPTANGQPGTHHVEARVFKDVLPRFKTMKGFSVPRRAGWDCHGLPVELAVEKELGLRGKPDVEAFGIAAFNDHCRESVLRHVDEFELLTERMGYWIDLSHAYQTMSPDYVDSVWWSLKQIYERGLLVEDFRVAPWCTRDQTTLSDHEVAQGYETVTDPSVFVKFPLEDGVQMLVWTTTPWTLVANTAVAVNPDATYVVAETSEGTILAKEGFFGGEARIIKTLKGRELEGLRYDRPFDLVDIPDAHRVVLADYVTTTDGTGLVHLAPAFGADDLAVSRANGLPLVNPIAKDGRFKDDVPLVGGVFFKEADAILVDELRSSDRLYKEERLEHAYPHCWRCHNPLMYYAQPSWYIRTTARRDALLRENEETTWHPEHIKHGRFGDWLTNNVDWALSRSRFWGTPLPLWRCPDGHVTVVGSRAELGYDGDPHRPFIDEVTVPCRECGQTSARVPEVIDAWYDSGAMPFASLGYPHLPGSREAFEKTYPAQYICEAIDQTRGWFYTLMAIGTLVFDKSAYENVVCLGHIVAEDGRKMSKHLGNVLPPIPLMDAHGADALRWFMACSGSPWAQRRVGSAALDEIVRKVLLTYWNTASFFTLYASHAPWRPQDARPVAERPVLDRWIISQTNNAAAETDENLENYDTARAGRVLTSFMDDLSNWYVRRSRQRFWAGDPDALVTLHECLNVVTRLLAPFVPFITEEVWQHVIRPTGDAESVHLASWPTADRTLIDPELAAQVATARAVAEAGRAARRTAEIRVRQPLPRALTDAVLPPELLADVADELNVREVAPLSEVAREVQLKPNFRALGKRFGSRTQEVAAALRNADPVAVVGALKNDGAYSLLPDVVIGPDEIVVTEVPRAGWVVESQRGVTVALDTTLTPELAAEGLARDVVRLVQQARRDAGLDISDRIDVTLTAPAEILAAVEAHRDLIARETLTESLRTEEGQEQTTVDICHVQPGTAAST